MFKNVLKKPGGEPLLQHTGKAKLINTHVNRRRAHGAGTVLQPCIPPSPGREGHYCRPHAAEGETEADQSHRGCSR